MSYYQVRINSKSIHVILPSQSMSYYQVNPCHITKSIHVILPSQSMSYYQVRISSKSLTTFTDFSCVFLFEFFDDGKVQLLLLGIYKSTCQFQCLCLQFQGGNMIGFCCTESPIPSDAGSAHKKTQNRADWFLST